MTLDELRQELDRIDRSLLDLIAQRQKLSEEIGRTKRASGLSPRNYAREKEVVSQVRKYAGDIGVSPELAESIAVQLIRASLTLQERENVTAEGAGTGKRALVIGGAGKIGRWLVRYLSSQGYAVEIADPAGPLPDVPSSPGFETSSLDHDLIVVAAPLRASNAILTTLSARRPTGLVLDVGSLKTPLREGLKACLDAGIRVASIHPMFGPDTELLSGKHVVIVDVGNAEAAREADGLFRSTMAIRVPMDLENHDRVMAFVLGLSHALNIAFFTALSESGEAAPRLAEVSSTTFEKQLAIARAVASENPHLYFEIQSLNEYGDVPLEALQRAVERLRRVVQEGDEQGFAELMKRGSTFFG